MHDCCRRLGRSGPRGRFRRSSQRRESLFDLHQPLLKRINPARQTRRFRRRRVPNCARTYKRGNRQYGDTNHEKDGDQDKQRGA